MSGEKGANLAPKEVCMGEAGEMGACGEGSMGASLSEESYRFSFFLSRQLRLRSSDDRSVNGFLEGGDAVERVRRASQLFPSRLYLGLAF